MSFDCSLIIHYRNPGVTCDVLIGHLLRHGWSLDNGSGHILYLPLHDNDEMNWQTEPVDRVERVLEIARSKETAGETVAVVLLCGTPGTGGRVLFYPDRSSLCLDVDRRRRTLVGAEPFTECDWYTERIVPPLVEAGCKIENLQWTQTP